MIKTRLLLASLLKPVNDSRFFEKIGLSLSQLPEVEVHICGYKASSTATGPNLFFHPVFSFPRLSWKRITAQFTYLKLLFRLKPPIIIIGTHELLLGSLLYKAFKPCYLIYDVQENYYLNLKSQKIYAPIVAKVAAVLIRLIETITSPFVDFFFLAEESYRQELPFIKEKYLVLQNKFKPFSSIILPEISAGILIPTNGKVNLLYSGTISELYGIFEAITFVEALQQIYSRYTLTIIGYWPQAHIGKQVKKLIKTKSYITLIGGNKLVPHPDIIQAIHSAHVGLLPYHAHPSLKNCVPTKLFEYLAHSLPIIGQKNHIWENKIRTHQAGFTIDFKSFNPSEVIRNLEQKIFYENIALVDVYWKSEEDKLLYFFKNILNGYLKNILT